MKQAGGRVVMVSGANKGIGRAIATHLLALGYRLSLGARQPAALREAFGAETDQLWRGGGAVRPSRS